jgi:hypothetical protein
MTVHFQPQASYIAMKLQIVENMGKELMLTGMAGDSFVRVSLADSSRERTESFRAVQRSADNRIYLELSGPYNLFDRTSGVNLRGADSL